MLVWYTGFRSVAFWKKILLLSFFYFSVFGESTSVRGCANLVNSPFEICTIAGYNHTIPFPEKLDDSGKREIAKFLTTGLKTFSCAKPNLAAALECSFIVPKCGSNGQRVYPCKRVCGELLKQCSNSENVSNEILVEFMVGMCLSLPDEAPDGDNCFEPPNFTTNDSVPSPLDRGCQKLIFPACRKLGIYNYTLASESLQKKFYERLYNRNYTEDNLVQLFPKENEDVLKKYPKCRKDIEKLFCGRLFPPCFPEEPKMHYKTLCRSVCNRIVAECPNFFSHRFTEAEACAFMAEGETSHGFCDQKEWPLPFQFVDYLGPTTTPTKGLKRQGPKGWVIAVAVVISLLAVGLALGGLIWWKWRNKAPSHMKYTRQPDEPAIE